MELLSGPSLGVLEVIIWSKFVFFLKTPFAKKNTIKKRFQHIFWKNNCAQKMEVIIWSKLALLRRTQLGPDNNFQKCHLFCIFCFGKCAEITIFIVFFEKQPKDDQNNAPPKNDNFSHFAKHRFITKKTLCCNPLFFEKLVFFELAFPEEKH